MKKLPASKLKWFLYNTKYRSGRWQTMSEFHMFALLRNVLTVEEYPTLTINQDD